MKKRFEDVERIRQIQQTSLEMMTVMHRGLSAIARGELSEVGALAMKRLAGQTLDEVQSIALDLNEDSPQSDGEHGGRKENLQG